MIQTLIDTGSPIIRNILLFRSSYRSRLLTALTITTAVVVIWVVTIETRRAPVVVYSVPLKTLEYEHLPEFIPELIVPSVGHITVDKSPLSVESELTPEKVELNQRVNRDHLDVVRHEAHDVVGRQDPLREMRITSGYRNKSLKYILDDITAQKGVMFVYPVDYVERQCCISLDLKDRTVYSLLNEVLTPRKLKFWQSGSAVAIYSLPVEEEKEETIDDLLKWAKWTSS